MGVPEAGRPWSTGDLLVMMQPRDWTVPAGWTVASDDGRYVGIWRRAAEHSPGDPDVYVVPPPSDQGTAVASTLGDSRRRKDDQ